MKKETLTVYIPKLILIVSAIVSFGALAGAVGYLIAHPEWKIVPIISPSVHDFYSCADDSDCISVKNDCCGCTAGGTATAINKNLKDQWKNNCAVQKVMCLAVMSNSPSCINKEPRCVNDKCILKEKITVIQENELSFETIEKKFYSENTERKNYVIKNNREWLDLYDKIQGGIDGIPNYPNADFTKDMVIAVFQGEKPTGGYDIEIQKIIETENSIEVSVPESSPGKNCMVTQAFTSPYQIVKVQRSDKEVVFNVEKVVNECN